MIGGETKGMPLMEISRTRPGIAMALTKTLGPAPDANSMSGFLCSAGNSVKDREQPIQKSLGRRTHVA